MVLTYVFHLNTTDHFPADNLLRYLAQVLLFVCLFLDRGRRKHRRGGVPFGPPSHHQDFCTSVGSPLPPELFLEANWKLRLT